MSKYIEWDLENNPDFFKRPFDGRYIDTGILRHVLCNVDRPEGIDNEAFEAVLNAVIEEVELIPTFGWIPASEPPERDGSYLAQYHFPQNSPPLIHFYGTLDFYATDPEPHWQHSSTGCVVDKWMPVPPDEREGAGA